MAYRIVVKDKSGNKLGEFEKFKDLQFSKRRNNYGSCSFKVPVDSPKVNTLYAPRVYECYIYSDDTLVWAGEQASRVANLQPDKNNWVEITCYTWLEMFNHRFTEAERIFDSYDNMDAGDVAWTLINESQHKKLIIDSYGEDNINTYFTVLANYEAYGQSFVGDGNKLTKISLYLAKYSTVNTGSIFVKIYNHSGVYGTSSVPTGSALATSDTHLTTEARSVGVFSELTSKDGYTKIDFLFDGTLTLDSGVNYVFTIEQTGTNDEFYLARDTTSPLHRGNACYLDNGSPQVWQPSPLSDVAFYAYNDVVDDPNLDLGITEGTIEATIIREIKYYNQNIMEAIVDLSEMEYGFDFEITDDKVFNVYVQQGSDKTDDIRLEYGVNVESAEIVEDMTNPGNRAIVLGQSFSGTDLLRVEKNDIPSQTSTKIREYLVNQNDVSDAESLDYLGNAVLRKYKQPVLSINLNLTKNANVTAKDIGLGDVVKTSIHSGIYEIDVDMRINEYSVRVDPDGAEQLSILVSIL